MRVIHWGGGFTYLYYERVGLTVPGQIVFFLQVNDKYIISHIIIPMQNGGPDYCQAENEEEILFVEEELGLITLGWIHVSN